MEKFACATKTGDFSINCRPAFSPAVFGVTSRYPGHPTLLFWPAAPPECALHYFPRPTWHRHERGGVRLFRHFHHRFQIPHTGQPATRETRSSGLAACPSSGGGTGPNSDSRFSFSSEERRRCLVQTNGRERENARRSDCVFVLFSRRVRLVRAFHTGLLPTEAARASGRSAEPRRRQRTRV